MEGTLLSDNCHAMYACLTMVLCDKARDSFVARASVITKYMDSRELLILFLTCLLVAEVT